MFVRNTLILLCLLCTGLAWALIPSGQRFVFKVGSTQRNCRRANLQIFMGRAAAVRARTKARTDSYKAKTYNRYAKRIIMEVKAGGPDPSVNRQLAVVIAEAKSANVPKDVIDRNIEKASASATADFKTSVFEFYGHGGVGILVNVLTDNDNRASKDIALVAKKQSLKPASIGSVSFNFERKARIDINGAVLDEDKVMEYCLEAGVDDYDLRTTVDGDIYNPQTEGNSVVYVNMGDMAAMRDYLKGAGFSVETSLQALPKAGFVTVSDEEFDLNMLAIDAFEELDDVDSIEHNINMVGDE